MSGFELGNPGTTPREYTKEELQERVRRLEGALQVAKRGIEASASDTVWCIPSDCPNCTVVEFLEITLSEEG